MIRLDVIVPVRNVDRYLGEALESTLHQGVEVSVVVVDAGSDDPIEMPPEFIGDDRIRLIRSDDAMTAGGARNVGASMGVAPWVSFLDADDRWPRGSRAALLREAAASSADMVWGGLTAFHADVASARRLSRPEPGQKAMLPGGIVVSRAAWNRVGEFDPSLMSGEFIEWFNRCAAAGVATSSIDAIVLNRRIHLESTTAQQIGNRDDYLKVVRRWMSRNDS